jgi:hypothetical protein
MHLRFAGGKGPTQALLMHTRSAAQPPLPQTLPSFWTNFATSLNEAEERRRRRRQLPQKRKKEEEVGL